MELRECLPGVLEGTYRKLIRVYVVGEATTGPGHETTRKLRLISATVLFISPRRRRRRSSRSAGLPNGARGSELNADVRTLAGVLWPERQKELLDWLLIGRKAGSERGSSLPRRV